MGLESLSLSSTQDLGTFLAFDRGVQVCSQIGFCHMFSALTLLVSVSIHCRLQSGLPSMGLHRVGHDWSDLAAAAGSRSPMLQVLTLGYQMCSQVIWDLPFLQETSRDHKVYSPCGRKLLKSAGSPWVSSSMGPHHQTKEWTHSRTLLASRTQELISACLPWLRATWILTSQPNRLYKEDSALAHFWVTDIIIYAWQKRKREMWVSCFILLPSGERQFLIPCESSHSGRNPIPENYSDVMAVALN